MLPDVVVVLAAAVVEKSMPSVGEYADGFAAYVVFANTAEAARDTTSAMCSRGRRNLGDMVFLSVRLRK